MVLIFFSQKFQFYLINTKKVFINEKLQAQHKYHVLKLVSGHFNLIEMIMTFFIKFKFHPINSRNMSLEAEWHARLRYYVLKLVRGHFNKI